MKRPLLLSAIIGVLSVIAVFYCNVAIFAAILFLLIFSFLLFKEKISMRLVIVLLFSTIILFSLSISLLKIERINKLSKTTVTEEFVITNEPFLSGGYYSADAVCLSDNTLKIGDKIRLFYEKADVSVGDTVRLNLKISEIKEEKRTYFYSNGIYAMASVKEFGVADSNSLLCLIPRFRKTLNNLLNASGLSYKAKAIIAALTLGDKSGLSLEFDTYVKASGTSHVMVVSGMHLVIIMGFFTKLIEKILYNKYLYALISLGGVLIIMAVCGFTMSIVRAGIMYIIVAAAPVLSRDSDPLNTLGTTVCLVLMVSPFAIFNISFQLSALSTLGILLLTDYLTFKICRILRIERKIPTKIVELVSITLAATIMTAPVCIYNFGFLSTVSLITNLLITYSVTECIKFSILGMLLGLLFGSGVSSFFLYIGGIFAEYTANVITDFGSLPFAILHLNKFFTIVATILAIALIILMQLDNRRLAKIKREV